VLVAQLLTAGLNHSGIARRVAKGSLHRVGPGLYAVVHAALSREAQLLAAVFMAGKGAALSHLAAAELWKAIRRRASLIDVVVPARRRTPKGVRVHQTRSLHRRDLTTRHRIPVTSFPRTLVDLSDVLTPHQLTNVIHEGAFHGHFSEPATRDAMARANGRHKLIVLEQALHLHAIGSAGTKSGPEDAFLALAQQRDLPGPLVNVHLEGVEVDFHWPDQLVAVEVDGPGHGRPRSRREDALKDRALSAAGYQVLRFTEIQVAEQPDWVAHLVKEAASTPRTRAA
jgi:very-short-patch-repair endonuclease